MVVLFQPAWLLLLVPLAVALWIWPPPNKGLRILRAAVFVLIVLAMAQFALRLPDRAGIVVVVADRSESMPPNAAASQKEIIELLQKTMKPRDLLGVVSFGQQAVIERTPQRGAFAGFTAKVGANQSALADAIDTALTLIPLDAGGRILVLSDGKWTGRDPAGAAARAAGRGIAIDYRLMSRPQIGDVAIQSFVTPDVVQPGQGFVLTAWVQSPTDQQIRYQLRRGRTVIAAGSKHVSTGLTRLMFRDIAPETGVCEYVVAVVGPEPDPVPENNQARALVGVEGTRPMLVVSSAGENSGLVKLLRACGLEITARTPAQCHWSLEELACFSAVLIENVSANLIGFTGMETLALWVEQTGRGLMLTGGQKAYGQGGYFKSPLERVLPISMEMRREHRKLSLAVVVALDRSGSMAVPVGGGRVKMDLANLGTVQVLDLLSPTDEFGVIAVDSSPHIIVPIDTVEKNAALRGKILSIDSMGGGIFIYEALSAAARMIISSKAGTRHIILFADAADSEEPGQYRELLEKCREANITVSVIGLGTEADVDAELLKDIARRGGGECYFTANAEEIPRLFAQDTLTVARSTFVEEPTKFQFTAAYGLLGLPLAADPPALGGYNLCYIRPEAMLGAVTTDEYAAPVVAFWNAGSGRVLCFCGEADGRFSGPFANWNHIGEFYSTLARWTAGKHATLPNEMLLVQQIRDGACFVQLHLDPERKADVFSGTPRVRTLHGLPGAKPEKIETAMEWKSADLLEAVIPIAGAETVLNTVEVPGHTPVALPPVCLPYSPEFAPEQPGRGAVALAQLAAATGGRERVHLPQIWAELPVKRRFVELTPWLLIVAVVLFLLEILERRTGWLFRLFVRRPAMIEPDAADEEIEPTTSKQRALPRLLRRAVRKAAARKLSAPTAGTEPQPTVKTPPAPAQKETAIPGSDSGQSTLDVFREARERASRRTRKEG